MWIYLERSLHLYEVWAYCILTFNDAIFVQCWLNLRACAIREESVTGQPCHICALVTSLIRFTNFCVIYDWMHERNWKSRVMKYGSRWPPLKCTKPPIATETTSTITKITVQNFQHYTEWVVENTTYGNLPRWFHVLKTFANEDITPLSFTFFSSGSFTETIKRPTTMILITIIFTVKMMRKTMTQNWKTKNTRSMTRCMATASSVDQQVRREMWSLDPEKECSVNLGLPSCRACVLDILVR